MLPQRCRTISSHLLTLVARVLKPFWIIWCWWSRWGRLVNLRADRQSALVRASHTLQFHLVTNTFQKPFSPQRPSRTTEHESASAGEPTRHGESVRHEKSNNLRRCFQEPRRGRQACLRHILREKKEFRPLFDLELCRK